MYAVFLHLTAGGAILLLFWGWAALDCISTDSMLCRNLPKGTWIFLVLFIPTLGSLAWLLLGRPEGAGASLGGQRSGYQNNPNRTSTRGFEDSSSFRSPRAATASDAAPRVNEDALARAVEERRLMEWQAELEKREARVEEAESKSADDDADQP